MENEKEDDDSRIFDGKNTHEKGKRGLKDLRRGEGKLARRLLQT